MGRCCLKRHCEIHPMPKDHVDSKTTRTPPVLPKCECSRSGRDHPHELRSSERLGVWEFQSLGQKGGELQKRRGQTRKCRTPIVNTPQRGTPKFTKAPGLLRVYACQGHRGKKVAQSIIQGASCTPASFSVFVVLTCTEESLVRLSSFLIFILVFGLSRCCAFH